MVAAATTTAKRREWRPHKGPQTEFLASPAFEVGFGGAAGPGKSECLLMGALRYVDRPDYRAILFRRTYPELEKSLVERARQYLPAMGAVYNEQKKAWTFPSGAKLILSHLQHESDVNEHLSAEYQYVGFDEGVTFTRKQFVFLMSRLRSSSGIPTRIRWASNPADDDDHWLIHRYAPWIDIRPSYTGYRAKPGEVLYFLPGDDDTETIVPKGTPGALSRTYFPSLLSDNPTLLKNDPTYADRIRAMGATEARRFLGGDWFARNVKGALFRQADFDRFRVAPKDVPELRYVVVAVDPAVSNTDTSDEHGIVAAGIDAAGHVYVLADWSRKGSPNDWGTAVVRCFKDVNANKVVGEANNGGDLVVSNIQNIDVRVPAEKVHAARGKDKRAELPASLNERGRIHLVGPLPELESECRRWTRESTWSPNHMDAFVWAVFELTKDGVVADNDTPPPAKNEEQRIVEQVIERDQRIREEESWG